MPTGFRNSAGVDWENLFEAGGVAAPAFRRADGSPVAFAARGSAPKGPNLNARDSAGVDLSNLWLPKGSAPPATDGGLPTQLSRQLVITTTAAADSIVTFKFTSAGSVLWDAVPPGSGTWTTQPGGDFDVQFTTISASEGTLTGSNTGWVRLDVDREVTWTVTLPSGGVSTRTGAASVRLQIRRRSDSVVWVDRTVGLNATVERTT